jgi:hypothetical protein
MHRLARRLATLGQRDQFGQRARAGGQVEIIELVLEGDDGIDGKPRKGLSC